MNLIKLVVIWEVYMYICHARKWIDFWYWISDTFRLVQMFPHLATSWIAKSALLEPTLLTVKLTACPWKMVIGRRSFPFSFRLILQGLRQILGRVIAFDWTVILLSWGQFAQAQFNFWVWELVLRNWFISVSYPYPIYLCLGSYKYTYTLYTFIP